MQSHERHAAAVKAMLDALPAPLHPKAICKGCPHPTECKGIPCLSDVARPSLEANAFSRLLLPAQAIALEAALMTGKSLRMITGGLTKYGPAICTPGKFEAHCAAYPIWGSRMKELAAENAIDNNKLKGLPHKNGTHCRSGRHELPNGGQCPQCKAESMRRGVIPSNEIIGKMMVQLLLKQPISSFTSGSSEKYILSHKNFMACCAAYPEINEMRLAIINGRRAKPKVRIAKSRIAKMTVEAKATVERSNVMVRLTSIIAAPPDALHSEIDAIVPRSLPIEMRIAIINDMWLAIKEGEISIDRLPQEFAEFKKAYNREFPTKFAPPSLDAPAYRDGPTSLIDTISNEEGMWR